MNSVISNAQLQSTDNTYAVLGRPIAKTEYINI